MKILDFCSILFVYLLACVVATNDSLLHQKVGGLLLEATSQELAAHALAFLRSPAAVSDAQSILNRSAVWKTRRRSNRSQLSAIRRAPRSYAAVRAYILTAEWNAERAANANRLSELFLPGHCRIVPGKHASDYNATELEAFVTAGWVSRRELPTRPAWLEAGLSHLGVLKALFPERPTNVLATSPRAGAALANTVGALQIFAAMGAASRVEARSRARLRTLYLYVEDDADVPEAAFFESRLLRLADEAERAYPRWDVLSLAPVPATCARSAALPWFDARSQLVHPRLAFSRTTAVAVSHRGVERLLAALPADNVIDLWMRRLMRQGQLNILLHCGGLVRNGAASNHSVARLA